MTQLKHYIQSTIAQKKLRNIVDENKVYAETEWKTLNVYGSDMQS